MSGFFKVTDIPERRVVQYKRTSGDVDGAVYVADDSVLGESIDEIPYADKTGLAIKSAYSGMVYELPYLPDSGSVYFSVQPESRQLNKTVATKLAAEPKAGKAPYAYQWYKDDKQVVNVPSSDGTLSVTEAGSYWVVVTDADGVQVVSKAAELTAAKEE